MKKSIPVHVKKRGRPATGTDPAITVRLPHAILSQIESFAKKISASRSEALRKIIVGALDCPPKHGKH